MARFIAVSGGIGAGKTTLIAFLQEHFGLTPFYERSGENPFLEDFYRDMGAWAFPSQVYFLTARLQDIREIARLDGTAIMDRTIYEDAEVFALNLRREGHLSAREHETYTALYESLSAALPAPDLLIFLKASARTQKKRILLRGNAMERRIDPGYLRKINLLYRSWIGRWDRSPLLTLDADRLDFVADLVHRADVLTELRGHLGPAARGGERKKSGAESRIVGNGTGLKRSIGRKE